MKFTYGKVTHNIPDGSRLYLERYNGLCLLKYKSTLHDFHWRVIQLVGNGRVELIPGIITGLGLEITQAGHGRIRS